MTDRPTTDRDVVINVNGVPRRSTVEPRRTLAEFLREDCALTGQYIPFKTTQADRVAANDPRPSVVERYPTFDSYDSKLIAAITPPLIRALRIC